MTIDIARADAYDAAADYLEQNGWHQGGYYPYGTSTPRAELGTPWTTHAKIVELGTSDEKPPMCMAGALGVYVTEAEWDVIARDFRELLYQYIADWNDDPSRTKEDVIDLLRMEALKLRVASTPALTKEEVPAA